MLTRITEKKVKRENNKYERDKLRCLTWEFKDGCSQWMFVASLGTWEVLKIVAPFVQKIVFKFWTLRPQASN